MSGPVFRSATRPSVNVLSAILATAVLALTTLTPTAAADPAINDHNCAGAIVSLLAGPGFGGLVSATAHDQEVDNLGLANCGQTHRNNP
jgi:hypothetical protein